MKILRKQQLVNKLAEVRGTGERAVYKRAKEFADADGLVTSEEALCLHALGESIGLQSYLDAEMLERIDSLRLTRLGKPQAKEAATKVRASSRLRDVRVIIAPDILLADPLLSATVANEAKVMAERVYPLVYVLENSMRAFITRIMEAAYGGSWWSTQVPLSVKNPVADRMKKAERTHWHGKRTAQPIYFTDTPHLIDIVEANWVAFKPYLPNKGFFTQRLREINESRRVIAHNNPLASHDRKRLEVFFDDWERHISGIAASLP